MRFARFAEAEEPCRVRLAARLRAGTALVLLYTSLAGPALAEGGRGGGNWDSGFNPVAGGAGGADNPTTPGDPGTAGSDTGIGATGGGGGGAGAGAGGAGGAGVSTIFGTSGSGGAGGAHGVVGAGLPAGSAAGGAGGNGGDGVYGGGVANIGGGGGGAGGYGAVVTGVGASGSVSGVIAGGRGGNGGNAGGGGGATDFGRGGSGGSGGTGLLFTTGSATLTITGTVRGGDGGAAGVSGTAGPAAAPGAGAGGEGIVGSDLTIVTSGTIAGGMSGDGVQAAALHFTGGTNTITFLGTTTGLTGGIIADGPTLTFDQATNVTVDNVISGLGAVIKAGTGTLTLSGANTYAGGTFVEAGTLSISADANLGVASSDIAFTGGTLQVTGTFTTGRLLNLANTGTVEVTAGQILTVNGLVMGAGGLEKTGAGTLVLTNSNVYGGGTTISGGTVSVSSDANLGLSGTTITLNNSTIVGGAGTGADAVLRTTATFSSNRDIAFTNGGGRIETDGGTTLTLSGSITTGGSASFIKQGAGTLVLTGDSSAGYNGRTWVNDGTLRIEGGGRLGSNSAGGQAYISNGATAIVTGLGSSWETFGQMRVGEHGSGTLRIEAGGSVRTGGGAGTVGIVGAGGDSSVTITGSGSQWVGNGTQAYIGHSNAGSLTLSDGGKFELTGASSVLQAGLVGGSAGGTVNIGAAEGSAAAAAGELVVDTVSLNTSASKLVFNHTSGSYTFAADITGAGSVRQLAGVTVLSGNNDYSGQTQVLGGRLVADSGGAFSYRSDYTVATGAVLQVANGAGFAEIGSLSGAGFVIIDPGSTLITGATNQVTTFSGSFSGDGSLEFVGSGTQIYTGTGTLGGGISVCACSTGSFIIRGGALTLGMDIQVEGGTLVVDQGGKFDNGPAVFAVTSSAFATSTVRIDGAGTKVTTGSALVLGFVEKAEVTISGGASLVGDGGAAVMSAGDGTATAVVTGAGSRWSIGGGSLFVGSLDGTGQASVTVAEGGALAIAAGDLGIGAEGTLRIGTGGRAGTVTLAAGAILNDGAIVTDFTDSATLAMAIDGTGTLSKRGSGTLSLTGTSTYTGATKVEAGKLVVNGSIANSVVTLTGGTLGGSGTIGGIVANTGATVAPGNSIGTLTVSGNVAFASGSTYQVEVNAAGQSDRIVASGSAAISGGTVQVLAESGNYAAATRYTILTASGGVTGQFSTVTSNLAFLTPSLAYDSQTVTLTMTRNDTSFGPGGSTGGGTSGSGGTNTGGSSNTGGSGTGGTSGGSGTSSGSGNGGTGNPTPPTGTGGGYVAATRNQGFIAVAAEALGVGNPVYDTLLSGTAAEARAGFDLLSGEAHAQAVSVMIEESRLVRDTILGHLRGPLLTQVPGQVAGAFSADLPGRKGAIVMPAPVPQPRYALWGTAFGRTGNSDADGNAASLNRRSGGALLGADVMLYDAPGSSLKIGVAGGYSQSRFDLDARLSSGRLESGHAALYAGTRFGNLRLDAGAAYSWSESDIRRQVAIRGFGDLLRLQRPGSVTQGFAELGYGFAFQGFALEPFAQLALIRVSTDAGTERGGAAALRVLSSEQTLGFSTLGLRAEAQIGAMPLFARAMLGWRHGFGELTPQARTAFVAGTTPATVFAAPIDREALVAEAGLDWRISQATVLGLTYSAAIGERSRDHALKGRVEMRF